MYLATIRREKTIRTGQKVYPVGVLYRTRGMDMFKFRYCTLEVKQRIRKNAMVFSPYLACNVINKSAALFFLVYHGKLPDSAQDKSLVRAINS